MARVWLSDLCHTEGGKGLAGQGWTRFIVFGPGFRTEAPHPEKGACLGTSETSSGVSLR